MEITINIPKNDYVQPTEVRQEVVQGICEAFLGGTCWSTFHPHSDGYCRRANKYIIRHKGDKSFYGFHDKPFSDEEGVKFNCAEMKAAFKALTNAGYYIFKVYTNVTWKGYKCSKRPFLEGGERVTEFNDFID